MEPYVYEPLPSPTSFRLIQVKANNQTENLVCSLEIVDLSVPPEYTALSYAWGDMSDTATIVCNGKAVQVTQSLYAALRMLADTPLRVWADALSIDQQNIPEKTQQVNMMALIYSKAAGVSIWLGSDPYNDAPVVLENIKNLVEGLGNIHAMGANIKHFDSTTGGLHWGIWGLPIVSTLPSIFVNPNEEEKVRVQRFFRLPWFSRTWVMQECGLASQAVVLWGDRVMDWNPIGVTAVFLLRYCRAHLDSLNLSRDVENVRDIYTTFSPFVPGATFFHLLNTARRYKASDARDKVFALLSHPTANGVSPWWAAPHNASAFEAYRELLTQFLPRPDEKFLISMLTQKQQKSSAKAANRPEPFLKADYSRTLEEVYLDLAWDHINRTETLEILTAVQHDPKSTSDLFNPSWVPRWDYFVDTPILGLYNSSHFASANRSAVVTPLNQDPKTLVVRGTLFSRIHSHTRLLTSSDFDLPLPSTCSLGPESPIVQAFWTSNPVASTWFSLGLPQMYDEDRPYPQILSRFAGSAYALVERQSRLDDAFLRTWVSGVTGAEVDHFDYEADSRAYWDRLFWGTRGNPSLGAEDKNRGDEEVRWRRYRDNAAVVCNQRKFFTTHKGFFGLGPGALKEGDRVAVFLGSDTPFVIREADPDSLDPTMPVPHDTKFKLVGECYVHGLMHGQAVRGREIERNIILQ
ncbi:heterokaryon incompatibility protein-domain-containing protein [Usnea florida]